MGRQSAWDSHAKDVDERVLGHLNLIESFRHAARWAKGGRLVEAGGVLLVASGTWIPVDFNVACRTIDAVDPSDLLREAEDFFSDLGRGYSIKVRDEKDTDLATACKAAGLQPFGEPAPEMIRRSPVEPPRVEGIRLEPLVTEQDVTDFAAVNANAYSTYGLPPSEAESAFTESQHLLAAPDVMGVVARDGERAVAAALCLFTHGIAGLYWVGTVEAARGKGLGAAVTAHLTNQALNMGAEVVTLQASIMGRPVYERLGFETLYHYQNYVCWRFPSPT